MANTACWKKIWLTVAGRGNALVSTEVQDILKLVEEELCDGVLQYKPYAKDAQGLRLSAGDDKSKHNGSVLQKFLQKLSVYLNLHSDVTWKVFCNFLIFEYYGKVDDIKRIAEYELYNTNLFQQLWLFYTSERMFTIKTMKQILEFANKKDHKFHKVYSDFIDNVGAEKIRNLLLDQFIALSNEIQLDNEECCLDFRDWVARNNQEQLEIIHSIILSTQYAAVSVQDFIRLFDIFRKHNFGANPTNPQVLAESEENDMKHIRYGLLSIMLVAIEPYWENIQLWVESAHDIEGKINTMYHEELCIMLLAWAALQLTASDELGAEKYHILYAKYIKVALEQNIFEYLCELVRFFADQECITGNIVRRAVFKILKYVSVHFEGEGAMLSFDGVSDLVTELVKDPSLATKFLKSDELFRQFYAMMIDMFPSSYVAFSNVTFELLQHRETFETVCEILTSFNTYTENYEELFMMDPEVTLTVDYRPRNSAAIVIPSGTKVKTRVVFDTAYVTFKYRYSYFIVLADLTSMLVSRKEPVALGFYNVQLGYRIMLTILKTCYERRSEMHNSLALVGTMLVKLSTWPFTNTELLALCLDIFKVLMDHEGEHVLDTLFINNFLPNITRDVKHTTNFLDENFLNTSVLLLGIKHEVHDGQQSLLFSYAQFVKAVVKENKWYAKLQVPGVVFFLVHVLPSHLSWNYETVSQRYRLTGELLDIILAIMRIQSESKTDEHVKSLYGFTYDLVVNHRPVVDALNTVFRISNSYLHARMMKECNWHTGSGYAVIHCVKKMLSLVNILFSLHNNGERCLNGTVFLDVFLDSAVKPSSLKLLTGYMQHTFDSHIPKLACQTLKKLAINPDIPMLSLLEMDKYQLQCTFLEKLRDPLEEEQMKVAILDLITLCVEKQNGMIVAFFDISHFPSGSYVGDSVSPFMEEYLENIRKSTDYLNSPIQAAILDLFHALWLYRKNTLVADLTSNGNFWSTLTDPVFRDLKLPNRTYSQILNILTFELFQSKGANEKINQVIGKLFSTSEPYAKQWCDHILISLDENNLVTYSAHLLKSWRNLLVATCKNYPQVLQDPNQRQLLTQTCLDGLIQHFSYPDDIRILSSWAETYLYLIAQWPQSYYKDYAQVLKTLTRVFKYLGEYYCQVNDSLKETMLSIAAKTVNNLQDCTDENFLLVDEYLHTIGKILEKEYMFLVRHESDESKNGKNATPHANWLLLLTFGKNLLQMKDCQLYAEWFKLTQFLHKLLTSIEPFIQNPQYFPIAKITVQCLITYAQSPLSSHYLYENLEPFYDATRPPKRYIYTADLSDKNAVPWNFEEWWLTYTGVVQLMTILMRKFGKMKLDTFFSFSSIHDDLIKNALKLPKVTTEHSALQLVSACLDFCYVLLKYKQEWRLNYSHIFFAYMQSINETVNAVTCIFLRPTILKFFIIDKESKITMVDRIPTACLVEIMNGLMEILAYCHLCLLRASPRFLSLLDPQKLAYTDDVRLEHLFHIPKMYDDSFELTQLKYGTLLYLLHFLCKAVSHIQMYKSSPEKSSSSTGALNTSDPLPGMGYLAFVCPNYFGVCSVIEKYNTLQASATAEPAGPPARWLVRMDLEKVNFALETLTTLLGVQTYLTIHTRQVEPAFFQHIKRELCSELLYFQEFTRKRISEQYQYRTLENMVVRKSYAGTIPYLFNLDDPNIMTAFAVRYPIYGTGPDVTMAGDFFVESGVDTIFYDRSYFDSINVARDSLEKEETPSQRSAREQRGRTWYRGLKSRHGRTEEILLEKVAMRYPSGTCVNAGDYLLMLSHWFFHMCQLSN